MGISIKQCCIYCQSDNIIKHGSAGNGKQRYLCRQCHKRYVSTYTYAAYQPMTNQKIVRLTKEGLGIRSTARVLHISTTTLLKRIQLIARNIPRPVIAKGRSYEVDELCTFIKQKNRKIWIVYALERVTRSVAGFYVGARTNKTLNVVLTTLKLSEADKIYTDGLKNYQYLMNGDVHRVCRYGTNHIERENLSLRTHLKRLSRKTICFTRSLPVLEAILSIYFWT